MIRHIVMWRVRGDTAEEREATSNLVKTSFEGLRGRIPGMRHLEIGIDSSGVDYACDAVLVTEFDSQEALDAYASHPEHLRVRTALGDLRTARFQVDYEFDAATTRKADVEHAHAKA
jgi:hypothetical protein